MTCIDLSSVKVIILSLLTGGQFIVIKMIRRGIIISWCIGAYYNVLKYSRGGISFCSEPKSCLFA